ncbi:hypothetical protein [Halogeometricum sp. CBA1124]|uniref:hypothetical protein n=1 Tax=Halogeometricum sp. CBA1124 TaxID=2668071 RepID=UPI0014294DCC|nr:hypothetical protein [Halogeometricum sp. CBA1124]MUV57600.1 hypothetical protein [Halogeometricum sp. CBA1124]
MSGSRDVSFARTLREWWLVNGDRLAVAAVLLAVVFAGSLWLTLSEVLRIGEGSYIPTLLGSGVLSGLATIITVMLSINQLILSRIFGAPNDLNDRLDATLDFRRDAAAVLDVTTVSNDPGTFLVEISEAVRDRASALEVEVVEVGDPSDGACGRTPRSCRRTPSSSATPTTRTRRWTSSLGRSPRSTPCR